VDMRKIPSAKAGNMAIPFQCEFKIRLSRAFAPPDTGKIADRDKYFCNQWKTVFIHFEGVI